MSTPGPDQFDEDLYGPNPSSENPSAQNNATATTMDTPSTFSNSLALCGSPLLLYFFRTIPLLTLTTPYQFTFPLMQPILPRTPFETERMAKYFIDYKHRLAMKEKAAKEAKELAETEDLTEKLGRILLTPPLAANENPSETFAQSFANNLMQLPQTTLTPQHEQTGTQDNNQQTNLLSEKAKERKLNRPRPY